MTTSAVLKFAEEVPPALAPARELWDLSFEAWLLLIGMLVVIAGILFLSDIVLPGHARSVEWNRHESQPALAPGERDGEALLDQSVSLGAEAKAQQMGSPGPYAEDRNPQFRVAPTGVRRQEGPDMVGPP